MAKKSDNYRSRAWFAKPDKDGFLHRSWMRNKGLPDHVFDGRPVIGICNTLVRTHALQHAFSPDCGTCKAGRLGERRISSRISRDVAWRDKHGAHRDAIPQSG